MTDHDRLNLEVLSIALKRSREEDEEEKARKKVASSLLLRQIGSHPMWMDYETVIRLLFETLHRNALYQEEPINVQLYARVQQHMYRIPPVIVLEKTRFAEVVRIDLIGSLSRQTETDDVLFYTYDFSYLRLFPALEIVHIANCHACLGSHLLESVPHLLSFTMMQCEIFWVSPDFEAARESGKVTLIELIDRTKERG